MFLKVRYRRWNGYLRETFRRACRRSPDKPAYNNGCGIPRPDCLTGQVSLKARIRKRKEAGRLRLFQGSSFSWIQWWVAPLKDTEFIAGFRDQDTLHFSGHDAVYQSNMKNNSYMDITREKKRANKPAGNPENTGETDRLVKDPRHFAKPVFVNSLRHIE